uniref:Uncharacterized protein LOC101509126 n=1 Tax=Cicer arietinum TaxID=3827 RepID=A0A3Q7XAD6_CICAR|nr:uncharacterized protein LOC101509126 [Cicer arietinum]
MIVAFTKGGSRPILPEDLEVAKMKHMWIHGLQPTIQTTALPPSQVTTPPVMHTIEPLPSPMTTPSTAVQPTKSPLSQVTTPRAVQVIYATPFQETSSHSQDELEISRKRNSTYWDVEVINEAGHISKTHLRMLDMLEAPPNVNRIVTRWNSDRQLVGSAVG